MPNISRHLLATVALAVLSAGAMGASYDFTDPTTVGSVSVSTFGGSLSTNTSSGERSGCMSAGAGLACGGDGLGIGDDEVTFFGERLVIDLGAQYFINSIEFLDVFNNANEGYMSEHAQFTIDDGAIFDAFRSAAQGSGNGTGGYLMYALQQPVVGQKLTFFTMTNAKSDFSVARVNVSEVPLPSTLGLLGAGLIVLGLVRRRS